MNRVHLLTQLFDEALTSPLVKLSKEKDYDADFYGECPHIKEYQSDHETHLVWAAKVVSVDYSAILKQCAHCVNRPLPKGFELLWRCPHFIAEGTDTHILAAISIQRGYEHQAVTEKGRQVLQSLTS